MIRLHQTFGAHAGRVIELDREVIRFGRLPDNEVAFDPHADLDASGRHAELRSENGSWVLVDVGSRNGTLVRGHRVTRHVLSDGDEIEFGVGGPRVRVELLSSGSFADGSMAGASSAPYDTGPATPIGGGQLVGPPGGYVPAHPTPPPSPFVPGSVPGSVPPSGLPPQGQLPSIPGAPGLPQGGMGSVAEPPKRYGQKTVGLMIQQAVQAAQQQQGGGDRSTGYIRAVAQDAASRSSRGLKLALSIVTVLLLLTAGAVVVLFFYTKTQEDDLHDVRDENVRLQEELAALGEGESAERARLAERIQELNTELHTEQEATGADIAERNEGAVWVLLRTRSNGNREVVCSGFAVRPDLLATNAHCVGDLERAMGRGDTVRAIPNRGATEPLMIRQMWRHPNYVANAPASPDVGLVRISGTAPQVVQLAPMSALSTLRTGSDVFVLGFPSIIGNDGAPVAGMTSGVVGRLTDFAGAEATPQMRHLVSHSAFTDDGAQGSPLFDNQGRVVAINAGNFRARRRIRDTGVGITRTVEGDTPYAWAVRGDLLLQLLAGMPN